MVYNEKYCEINKVRLMMKTHSASKQNKGKNPEEFFARKNLTFKLTAVLLAIAAVQLVVFTVSAKMGKYFSLGEITINKTELYATAVITVAVGFLLAFGCAYAFLNNVRTQFSEISKDATSKVSNMLEVAGKTMAIFEIYENRNEVYITKQLFEMLCEPDESVKINGFIPMNVFEAKFSKLKRYYAPNYSTATHKYYHIEEDSQYSKWVRMTTVTGDGKIFGLFEDVSEEMLTKNKMEFERDYDVLTSLFNRRAFHAKMQKLLSNREAVKVGAMFSIDLDNLKHINDNYGHYYGDEYLRSMAAALNEACGKNALISRFGGDEFVVFVYGFESKKEIRDIIVNINITVGKKLLVLPDGDTMRLSASGGVAWYPEDSESYMRLINYSDFAMYTVKKGGKGGFAEFSLVDYENNTKLKGTSGLIRSFINKKEFEYTFQPIVDAQTGDIFAYEALLKSKHPMIKSPKQLFDLSKSQMELYEIEKMTWNEALSAFDELRAKPSVKLFINSISDQALDVDDMNQIRRNYCHLLKQVVLDLSNAGNANIEYTKMKQAFISEWGGEVAIADFGTGSYSDDVITDIAPEYLKVDISITQNLYRDDNRHKFVEGLVAFAHQRGIKVIAEGIEKPEDMFTLIDIGVDYLQGYHLARPSSAPPKMLAIATTQISAYNKKKAGIRKMTYMEENDAPTNISS